MQYALTMKYGAGWLVALLLLFVVCPFTVSAGEEVTVDGVVHVKNGTEPSQGVETLKLEELWSAGGEDDEETVMGLVVQALSDEDGNVYLLDLQLSQVLVYSADGEVTGTLSRQGEGPGESTRPSDMLFLPDGTLGLLQTFPGKLIKVTLEDEPAGVMNIGDPAQGGFAVVIDGKCRAGNLALAGTDISIGESQAQQTRTNYLASFAEDGTKKATFWENAIFMDFANLKIHEKDQYSVSPRRWTLGPNGDVYAAVEREKLTINVYAPDGTLKRVIEKEFTNRKRTQKEQDLYNKIVETQVRQLPGAEITLADTPEAVQGIEVTPDGHLWVLSSRSNRDQDEGIMMTYDVFDKQGHYVKQARIECGGNGEDDALIRIGDDRMILIRGLLPAIMAMQSGGATSDDEEDAEPMEVVCYRIGS